MPIFLLYERLACGLLQLQLVSAVPLVSTVLYSRYRVNTAVVVTFVWKRYELIVCTVKTLLRSGGNTAVPPHSKEKPERW